MHTSSNGLKKIYGDINGITLPGIKTATGYLFYFNGMWFSFIPDSMVDRNKELEIDRSYLLDYFKEKDGNGNG